MEQWLHMQPASRRPIRVLVVDDSAFMRSTIARLLEGDPEFQVVGNASDGLEAIEKVEQLGPDVVTMDVEMPRMTGIEALDVIMHRVPTPVVMLSVFTTSGATTTIDALAKGAIDFVTKPSRGPWGDVDSVTDELKEKLRRAASISPMRLHLARASVPSPPLVEAMEAPPASPPREKRRSRKVVVIATSTGGPAALTQLIPSLPGDLPAGVLVVQHMPAGFTRALADRLDGISQLSVREARAGEPVQDGTALIAPGNFHMVVDSSRNIELNLDPPVHSVRPAADVLLSSVARAYGGSTVAVVLTGMGHDGAAGATEIKQAGGHVIVQDEPTSVIYGMAASVVEAGSADVIAPLPHIAVRIVQACGLT